MEQLTQMSSASPLEDGRRNEWRTELSTKATHEGTRKINKL